MLRFRTLVLILAAFLVLTSGSLAQVQTGQPNFGTFSTMGPDVINIGNLNVLWTIPILNKSGRGSNFVYNLAYNSSVWYPATSGSTQAWTPVAQWGWQGLYTTGQSEITYDVTEQTSQCYANGHTTTYTQWNYGSIIYLDPYGTQHAFNTGVAYIQSPGGQECPPNGPQPTTPLSVTAPDGSGYTITMTGQQGYMSATLKNRNGVLMNVPVVSNPTPQQGTQTITDTNGNQITVSGGQYTDTTGTDALNVTNASGTTTLSYTTTTGATAAYVVSYQNYAVKTAFGCSGVSEYTASSVPLVSRITLPDSSFYAFTYETTPGASGDVTGRISSVTLPTGGQISYSYTGGSEGIVCADGSTAGFTRRMTASGNSPASTWTYTRTPATGTSTTAVVDGLGNNLSYSFTEPSTLPEGVTAAYYETKRVFYEGAASGTPVLSQQTCYGSSASTCPSGAPSQPFELINTTATWNGTEENQVTSSYNSYGLLTEVQQYDFGTPPTPGALLAYQTWTYPTTGIPYLLTSTQTFDAAGDLLSKTSYGYDQTTPVTVSSLPNSVAVTGQRGNMTSMVVYGGSGGSSTATTTYTYDTAGQLRTISDPSPAGNLQTLTYDSGTDVNLIGTSQTINGKTLTTSYQYWGNTGLLDIAKDYNGNPTTYTYDSSLRNTGIAYPDGGSTTATPSIAANASTIPVTVLHTSGNTLTGTVTLDGYGRQQQLSINDSPSADLTVYTYDPNGNLSAATNPYRSTSDPTYGSTTYSYDVLGRLTGTTAPDGSPYTTTFTANTQLSTDPAGKQREQIMDGMGRISQVLEPNASNVLSLLTTYKYLQNFNSSAGTTQTIIQQQGGSGTSSQWRTRTFTTDMVGRTVSANVPESGTTTYTYSGFGSTYCAGNISLPCSRTDARGAVTNYTYDGLYRPTGKTYSGTTPATAAVTYLYDQTSFNGLTIANGLGNRTGMEDGSGETGFSFDTMNRVKAEAKTIDGVTKSVGYTYNLDGTVNTLTDFYGDVLTYGYTTAGHPKSVSDSSGYNFASSAVYSPAGGITSLLQGNSGNFAGVTTTNSFNKLFQPSVISAQTPSATVISLTYGYGPSQQNNGNISSITNNLNSARSQVFQYDQLNRLSSAQATTLWGDTYVYDNWGNLLQKNPISGVGQAENMTVTANASNQLSSMIYDAAGEATKDNLGNTWTYDAEGHPTVGASTSYLYDGDGHRVLASTSGSGTLFWAGPDGKAISESDLSGNQLHRNVYFDGAVISRQDNSGATHYFVRDQVGSERISVNANGSLEDDIDYYPWGNGVPYVGSYGSADPYTFGGYYADGAQTATYHTDYRQQSPSMGSWLRPDPYYGSYDFTNPQSFNRYTYASNNPLSRVDPNGLDDTDDPGGGDPCADPSITCIDGGQPVDGGGDAGTGDPDPGSGPVVNPGDPFVIQGPGLTGCGASCTIQVEYSDIDSSFMLLDFIALSNLSNPCSNANAAALDYNVNNAQTHILNNHVHIGKPKSVYASDWTGIQALNASTLSFGTLAPPSFQRPGTYALQWDAPQPFSWMGISNYIGFTQAGDLTTRNLLVVQSNCKSVVTSYPIPD